MNSMEKHVEVPHKYNLNAFYRFFCWCSGARLYLLRSCPTDYNKFFGIGIIVFLTGIMASITGSYALFVIFDSLSLAIAFGIFWGILIFFLDWYIVASLKKEERFFSEFLFSIPRIILAILLAIVISRPLELKLFEKEINGMLQSIHSENSIEYNQLIDKEFENVAELKQENETLQSQIKEKEELRNKLFNMMIEEAEGRSPTSKIGKGNVYKEKKAEYDKIDKELQELKQTNNTRIEQNKGQISKFEARKQEQLVKSNDEIKRADGLLARFEAMSVLAEKNPTVKYASWFIFLLFVLIEASPILVKLLSRRGPYDELIEKEEYEKQIEYKKQKIKAKILANNYLELLKQKDELQIEAEKRNNEKLVDEIEKAKDEINKLAVGKWKQKEIDALSKEVEEELKESQNNIETKTEIEDEDNTIVSEQDVELEGDTLNDQTSEEDENTL